MQNKLENGASGGEKRRRKTKPRTRVTIICGLICKDGIAVACDSQSTYGTGKRDDIPKISEITFKSGHKALVARAGSVDYSARAIEMLAAIAKETDVSDYRTVADAAVKAVIELKSEIKRVQAAAEDFKTWIDYYRENEFSFLIAYYYQNASQLYELTFEHGIAIKRETFATLGCGAPVANFMLTGWNISQLSVWEGALLSGYIIEEVKKVDAFCGGPCRVGMIESDGKAKLFPEDPAIALMFSEISKQAQNDWKARVREELKKLSTRQ